MADLAPEVEIPEPQRGLRSNLGRMKTPPGFAFAMENWLLRYGDFGVRPGFGQTFGSDINQRATGFAQYKGQDGGLRTVIGTTVGWHKFDAGTDTWADITGTALTASVLQKQIFRTFKKGGSTILLGINAADVLQEWDGEAAAYNAAAGSPPKAVCMGVAFNRVLLGNLLSGSTISSVAVEVSADLDFESGWGSNVTLLADTPGAIVCFAEAGALQTYVIKKDAIYAATAISGLAPFRYDIIPSTVGMRGPSSANNIATDSRGFRYWLGEDGGAYRFDGVGITDLGEHIRKYVTDNGAFASFGRSFSFVNQRHNELWIFFPETGNADCNLALLINLANFDAYPFRFDTLRFSAGMALDAATGLTVGELAGTIGSQTLTIGEFRSIVPRVIVADINGQSYMDVGNVDGSSGIIHSWETGMFQLGSRRTYKRVEEVDHHYKSSPSSQTVSVQLGYSEHGEEPTFTTAQDLDVGAAGPYVTGHRQSGRLFSLKKTGTNTDEIIYRGSVAGVEVDGVR